MTDSPKPKNDPAVGGLDLTIETLDQWEDDLDRFAAEIQQRLSLVSMTVGESATSDTAHYSEEHEALALLRSIRELNQ